MIDFLDIASMAIAIVFILVALISLTMFVDMIFDRDFRVTKASLMLFVAGLAIYGLNSMTGY